MSRPWRLCGFLLLVMVAGCDRPCTNDRISEVVSPSKTKRAIVFSRECGATVGFNTQVSIVSVEVSVPNEPGNTLILDGKGMLKLKWVSESELVIQSLAPGKVYKQERNVNGVIVRYE